MNCCVHTSKKTISSTVFTLNNLETNYTKLSCQKCFLMKKRDALASIKASPGGRRPCPFQEAKHLRLSNNITCKPLPQYLQQGFHPKRLLQEILQ